VEQGKITEAINHYQEALRLNANNPEAHFNLAFALLRANQKAEAAAHLAEGLRLNPNNADARRQLEVLSSGKPEH
jgi:tetratricopeptide (TPR) repeat protein